MSRTRSWNLDEPDESLAFDHGKVDLVVIADQTVGRTIHEPGWRWSTHIRPVVRGSGVRADTSGRSSRDGCMSSRTTGRSFDVGPYDVIDVAPAHDATHAGRTDSARYAKVRRDAHSEGR